MKAYRQEPEAKFIPVTLVLESQHEVDAIYAMLNDSRLCNRLGLPDDWKCLLPYRNHAASDALGDKINLIFRNLI